MEGMEFVGREKVRADESIGYIPSSWAEADVSVCAEPAAGLDARGGLGVRGTRGVTGERQSSEGDDKKDVEIPVVKLSPKDLGRSMLI